MKKSHMFMLLSASVVFVIIMLYFALEPAPNQALVDEQYLPALLSELSSAKSSIRVIMFESRYYNQTNSSANEILRHLAAAKAGGIDVKVIFEGGETFLGVDFSEAQQRACDFLSANGVPVRFDPKKITTHAKLVLIDNHKVLIGSTNWNYNALEQNHETSVLIYSPDLAGDFEKYFDDLWNDSADCESKTL